MRRILLVLASFLAFAAPAAADNGTQTTTPLTVSAAGQGAAYTRTSALQAAENASLAYWGVPNCGIPQERSTDLPPPTIGETWGTSADTPGDGNCYSDIDAWIINQAPNGPAQFFQLCQIVAHETGHLALPDNYFVSDPKDMNESADPHNIMFEDQTDQVTIPQCLTAIQHPFRYDGEYATVRLRRYPKSGGCAAMLYSRHNKRIGLEAWPCILTDRTRP